MTASVKLTDHNRAHVRTIEFTTAEGRSGCVTGIPVTPNSRDLFVVSAGTVWLDEPYVIPATATIESVTAPLVTLRCSVIKSRRITAEGMAIAEYCDDHGPQCYYKSWIEPVWFQPVGNDHVVVFDEIDLLPPT